MSDISIIMPVLNSGKFVNQAIESVLNQSYKDFNFIIIDSSTDGDTSDFILAYSDIRIKYYYVKGLKITNALNHGIYMSDSKYLARMDADDISSPYRIEEQYLYLERNKNIDIVGTNYCILNAEGDFICNKLMPENHANIEFAMPIKPTILHPTIMVRRSVYEKLQGYSLNYLTEDTDLFLRALTCGFKMYNIQKILYKYRVAGDKSCDFVAKQKISQKILGEEYVEKKYLTTSDNTSISEKYYLLGLINYYNGSVQAAKKYFNISVRFNKKILFKILRYYFISLLGDRLVNKYRKNHIFSKVNIFIMNYFNFDTNRIIK